ncbi:MAG: 23S rRNA (adenine(2503)-C(2))-methyltransferase RlmN [Elusimicrobiota bacterium]
MDPKSLNEFIKAQGLPAYRAGQALKVICTGARSYEDIRVLPAELRKSLGVWRPMLSFTEDALKVSRYKEAFKARLRLADGELIESVLMRPKPGFWSVCVSSQVGCALKCAFCATGTMGFKRNLTAEEIADQVIYWVGRMRDFKITGSVTNIVFMGMGEPMLNFDAVKQSIDWLTHPGYFALGRRSITVSTVGIVAGMDRFTEEMPQINLALSLHAASENLRTQLVPVNKAFPLEELILALKRYFLKNSRKVFLEYVLLAGQNDTIKHADQLAGFVNATGHPRLMHVNLIVWNPTKATYVPTTRDQAYVFKKHLLDLGVHVTIRKNLGQDIDGACGQLVTKSGA